MAHLKNAFNVFRDIDGIQPGDLFPEVIRREMRKSDVMVVVVGTKFFDADHLARFDKEDDPVRVELTMALALGLPLLPVTVEGAQIPTGIKSHSVLEAFASLHAHDIGSGRHFEVDLKDLEEKIRRLAEPRMKARQEEDNRIVVQRDKEWNQKQVEWELRQQQRDTRHRRHQVVGLSIIGTCVLLIVLLGLRVLFPTGASASDVVVVTSTLFEPHFNMRDRAIFLVKENVAVIPRGERNDDGTYSLSISTYPASFMKEIQSVVYLCDDFGVQNPKIGKGDSFSIQYKDVDGRTGILEKPVTVIIRTSKDELSFVFAMEGIKNWL